MNYNQFFIVLVFAVSSIAASSLFSTNEQVSGERLKDAMDTCKALVESVEYEHCMKNQSILSVALISKAYKVKDDEIINHEELIADVADRTLAVRENFAAYCNSQSDLTLYNEFTKNQKVADIFVNELSKINEDEVIDYQKFIIDLYKTFIINARSGVTFPFE